MARYASDNRLNLKVGVSSFSKDLTSLEVVGRLGINSTTAQNELDVAGSVNITDGLSVGGLSTFTGVGTFGSDLYVGGDLYVKDDVVFDEIVATNLNIAGFATVGSLKVTTDTEIDRNLLVAGVSTLTGIVTTGTDLYVGGDLYINDDIIFDEFSGRNINISGVATIGNLNVAGLTTTTDLTVFRNTQTVGVTTLSSNGGITTTGGDLFVGGNLFLGGGTGGQLTAENLNVTGVSTLNTLGVTGLTTTKDLLVTGISTLTGIVTTGTDLYVGGNLFINDNITFNEVDGTNLNITGVGTFGTLAVSGVATTKDLTVFGNTQTVGVTTLSSAGGITTTGGDFFVGGNFFLEDLEIGPQGIEAVNLNVTGVATIATLGVTGLTTTKDLLVTGISTFTGIVTTSSDLYVENDLYVKGNSNLNDTLVSGTLTATTFSGAGTGLTGITSATNATNIYGGLAGQLLYQAQPGVTSAFEYGSTNFALVSRGLNNPPQWAPAAPSGAIEGILLFDEGTQVGGGVTYAGIDFRGQEVLIEGAPLGGIATVYVSRQPYVEQAGVSTSVVGGVASVTSLNVTGITTLNTVNANSLNVDVGISSFADFKITSSGVGATVGASAGITTYYGRGTELVGIVTTITAGPNISIDQSTGNVTITGIADTSILVADSLFVTGITTLNAVNASSLIVSGITTLGVVTGATYYGNGNNLTGIVTSLVAGDNISLSGSQGEVTITGLAKTDRITAESLVVTGVSTFQGQVNAGVVTATSYSGNGINLAGIVTTITAGPNIAINQSTGNVTITGIADTSVITADNLFVTGVSTFQGQVTAGDVNSSGVVTATSFSGSGTNLSGIVTSLIAGPNISLSGSTGEVTITGLANTANVNANTLVVSGVSTLGIVTGAESIGVVTVYANNFVGGDFTGGNATFSGNVAIGGTLTYEDVSSIDAVGFITAREGINVGVATQTGVGVTFLANGTGVFAGIVTVSGDLNVGSASSQFTVQQTATTVEVGIGTIDPNYNLDVRGTANIEGRLSVDGNTVPSLAMVVALGGF